MVCMCRPTGAISACTDMFTQRDKSSSKEPKRLTIKQSNTLGGIHLAQVVEEMNFRKMAASENLVGESVVLHLGKPPYFKRF